ncbi:hypothetical protein CCR75_005279 [Bremia lactucae]|uniref:CMP/dCMP-type deaminase domain-containing protein n=1 Tax=Bremia lactucae TaxID=4779 RepID=A0A976ICU2_BRELC|nr:hypothetical protein CCR75_005279 [Bremia lactucae]
MHAEIVAIEFIAAKYGDKASKMLADCSLYVTCEPCIMCAGALAHVFIKHVYFGCHNDRFGGCSSVLSLHERSALPDSKLHRGYMCVSGILKDEAIALLKKFYVSENPRGKNWGRKVDSTNIYNTHCALVENSKKKRKLANLN